MAKCEIVADRKNRFGFEMPICRRGLFSTSVILALSLLLLVGCGQPQRPTLVPISEVKAVQVPELGLAPAPKETMPLDPAPKDFAGESSVGDAIYVWASHVGIDYVDACGSATLEPGQYCDVATEEDQVRMLGFGRTDIRYVLVVEDIDPGLGASYRVTRVMIAGR